MILDKTDSELVMDSLLSLVFGRNPLTKSFPRVVFQHMLAHRLVNNPGGLEEDLRALRQQRVVKSLYTEDLLPKSGSAFMYTRDYLKDIERLLTNPPLFHDTRAGNPVSSHNVDMARALALNAIQSFMIIVQETDNLSFSKSELQSLGFKDAEHVDYIQKLGYLRFRRANTTIEDMYWLGHPQIGSCISSFRMIEQQVLPSIRRMKYKELSSKQILKLVVKHQLQDKEGSPSKVNVTIDHFEPYLVDLLGRNLVKKVLIPSSTVGYMTDYILRLE
jgi:hypothetical protein